MVKLVVFVRKVEKMKIQLIRTQFGTDATNGLLFIDGQFECYTLEDQYQAVKVMHETCIPEGTYKIIFRKVGGFHERYSKRYQNAHYGMLWLQDVPEFEYILIHGGNTDDNTSGCIIVGDTQQDLDVSKDGFIGASQQAYQKMYRRISSELLNGKEITIEISKINLSNSVQEITNTSVNLNDLKDYIEEKMSDINGNLIKINAKIGGRIIT
jgi:hypothetical protein